MHFFSGLMRQVAELLNYCHLAEFTEKNKIICFKHNNIIYFYLFGDKFRALHHQQTIFTRSLKTYFKNGLMMA